MGTMSVPCRTLCLTLEVANGDIWFFDRKRLAERVALATTLRVPSFKNTASVFLEILFIQYFISF